LCCGRKNPLRSLCTAYRSRTTYGAALGNQALPERLQSLREIDTLLRDTRPEENKALVCLAGTNGA